MLNHHSTGKEIRDKDPKIAVLPVGATEQHGPHLPVATDALIATLLAARVSEALEAYCLPTVSITTSMEHRGGKGTVWVSHKTLYTYLEDIIDSLHEQGFERVLILYTHGGVKVVDPLVIQMNYKYNDMGIIGIRPGKLFYKLPEAKEILQTGCQVHADEVETSMLLYAHPTLVRTELIEDCVPEVETECLNLGSIFQYSHNGVWGYPSHATAEKGEKMVQLLVDRTVALSRKLFTQAFENKK